MISGENCCTSMVTKWQTVVLIWTEIQLNTDLASNCLPQEDQHFSC